MRARLYWSLACFPRPLALGLWQGTRSDGSCPSVHHDERLRRERLMIAFDQEATWNRITFLVEHRFNCLL